MEMSIQDAFQLNLSLSKLFEQEILLPLKCGYDIYRILKYLNELEEYVFQRMEKVIPREHLENGNLTEEDTIIYNSIINSKVTVPKFEITKDELMSNIEAKLSLQDISNICQLFEQK